MAKNENGRMSGNKGEWGESYVALHLLAYGRIFMANANGEKNVDEWMNVIDVIRHETKERVVMYHNNMDDCIVEIKVNGINVISILVSEFVEITRMLRDEIRNSTGRSFNVSSEVTDFLEKVQISTLKAKSIDKSDIFLTVLDPRSSIIREKIGFSIKTKFGHNPTLFNTAPASGVVYKVKNMTDDLMDYINTIVDSKGNVAVTERCRTLLNKGCELTFVGFPVAARAKCEAFKENLELINPMLPDLIERILWNHFFKGESKVRISDVVNRVVVDNPMKLTRPDIKYPYMMKSFLYASYCGMTASTLWDGKSEVNGGFVTVDEAGEVLAHYALESENFKEYLYNVCYLEFPATGPKHGNYASVYKVDDEYYYNLNFQIRIG